MPKLLDNAQDKGEPEAVRLRVGPCVSFTLKPDPDHAGVGTISERWSVGDS